jgi:pimeloyl-ACP methyl ester carboxylesterase
MKKTLLTSCLFLFFFISNKTSSFAQTGQVWVTISNPDNVLLDYARDIKALIDEFSPDQPVTLVGLSMGAYSCMQYFELFGTDRVQRYLNIDQGPKAINGVDWNYGIAGNKHNQLFGDFERVMAEFDDKLDIRFKELPKRLQLDFLREVGRFFEIAFHRSRERRAIGRIFSGENNLLSELAKQTSHAANWRSYYYCLKSYLGQDYDFRSTMAAIDIPITLHIGRFSEMYPARGQYFIAHHAPQCKVVEFDEGHGLMYTAPVKFSLEFGKFLYL